MRRYILLLNLILWMVFAQSANAACEKPCPPPDPCMKSHPMPCDRGENMGMMMFCDMMKEKAEFKTLLKSTLLLQQRSLKASAKEKAKIKTEIDALIKRLDAMPNMMDCPIMQMMPENCMDRDVQPSEQTKEEAKPPEHQH